MVIGKMQRTGPASLFIAVTINYFALNFILNGGFMIQRNIDSGYGTVTKEAMQDRELTIEAKAIYAYLCSFAGGKDEAWPSVSKICYDLNISENRMRKHLNVLIDKEYIDRCRRRFSKSKQWASNVYEILK